MYCAVLYYIAVIIIMLFYCMLTYAYFIAKSFEGIFPNQRLFFKPQAPRKPTPNINRVSLQEETGAVHVCTLHRKIFWRQYFSTTQRVCFVLITKINRFQTLNITLMSLQAERGVIHLAEQWKGLLHVKTVTVVSSPFMTYRLLNSE